MKLNLERSGGFTGIRSRIVIDTETLDPQEGETLQSLVKSSGFFNLPDRISAPTPGADRFVYRVSIEDAGRSHTVEVGEAAIPEDLRPLIDQLTQLGRGAHT